MLYLVLSVVACLCVSVMLMGVFLSNQCCQCECMVIAAFCDLFISHMFILLQMRGLKLGDGSQPGVTQGPLINQAAVEKVATLAIG